MSNEEQQAFESLAMQMALILAKASRAALRNEAIMADLLARTGDSRETIVRVVTALADSMDKARLGGATP